jgi:hypothetical protein
VGSCRREILDHVIALNESHLRRLVRDYVNYHREDRIHDGLSKDTPNRRPIEQKPTSQAIVISLARLGGHIIGTGGMRQHKVYCEMDTNAATGWMTACEM